MYRRNTTRNAIDDQIRRILNRMDTLPVGSEEYLELMKQLDRLNSIKDGNTPNRVSKDTMLLVAGNLIGIAVIVAYEQKHVLNAKAFSHTIKPK